MTNHKRREQVIIIIFYGGSLIQKYEERFDRLTRIATKLF
uniref:GGDEF domain protein n=1 Tax=Klebsiella pneumoniae TaxID=573 RepID=A0A8B0ST32_KLEPN|nr:GGDEF domain protein [Klebsiella pneumoniae]